MQSRHLALPVTLLPKIAQSRKPSLAMENNADHPCSQLSLKIALTQQAASLAMENYAQLVRQPKPLKTKATQKLSFSGCPLHVLVVCLIPSRTTQFFLACMEAFLEK